MNRRMTCWKISPVARVVPDGGECPCLPCEGGYYFILDRVFKDRVEAQQVADKLTEKYDIGHIVVSCDEKDIEQGTLHSCDPCTSTTKDIELVLLDNVDQVERFNDACEGEVIEFRVTLANSSDEIRLKNKYPWFNSGTILLRDVDIRKADKPQQYLVKGTVANSDQLCATWIK